MTGSDVAGTGADTSPGSSPRSGALLEVLRLHALASGCRAELEALSPAALPRTPDPDRTAALELRAIAAVSALDRRTDGTGDQVGQGIGSFGIPLAMGASPLTLLRHHLGLAASPSEGRDGGAQWSDPPLGLVAAATGRGVLMEILAGITMGFRMKGQTRVGMILDLAQAATTGAWHEGLNLAAVRRAPLVVVVGVEGSAPPVEGTPQLDSVAFLRMCPGYGVNGVGVDGNDPEAILVSAGEAVRRARAGEGVQLLALRDRAQRGRQRLGEDPIRRFAARLGAQREDVQADSPSRIEAGERRRAAEAARQAAAELGPSVEGALAPVHPGAAPTVPWYRRSPPSPVPVSR